MQQSLKNLILRSPESGRLFLVEKDPFPDMAPLTLRRLDREIREQAHIYRRRAEVATWTVLEPRPENFQGLLDKARALLAVWDQAVKRNPGRYREPEIVCGIQDLADAVEG